MLKYPAGGPPVFSSTSFASPELVPFALGARGEDVFGRSYRFCKVGSGAALVAGNCIQGQAEITTHQAMTPGDTAIGATSITVTPGATAGAADLYAGGIAVIDTTPGEGYTYPIKGHLAITASVAFVLNLANGWPVKVALTAAGSKVNIYPSPYRNVIQSPQTTASGPTAGVAPFPIAASEWGWLGTNGPFGTLITGTPAIGALVTSVGAVAGAAAIWSSTLPAIGTMMELGVDTKIQGVRWNLP